MLDQFKKIDEAIEMINKYSNKTNKKGDKLVVQKLTDDEKALALK